MKVLLAVLILLVLALQYRLWFGDGSIQELSRLREQASASRAEVLRLNSRNQALAAEVADLKSGLDAIEERARADLGMIGEGETFYQFVRESGAQRRRSGDDDQPAEREDGIRTMPVTESEYTESENTESENISLENTSTENTESEITKDE